MSTTARKILAMATAILLSLGVLLVAPANAASTTKAPSAASKCRSFDKSGSDGLTKYIIAPGWGFTGWRVYMHAYGKDKCTSGYPNVKVWLYDKNVTQKGGKVKIDGVYYQSTSFGKKWIPMYKSGGVWTLRNCWANGERITKIKVHTSVWAAPDAGTGDIGLATGDSYLSIPK